MSNGPTFGCVATCMVFWQDRLSYRRCGIRLHPKYTWATPRLLAPFHGYRKVSQSVLSAPDTFFCVSGVKGDASESAP